MSESALAARGIDKRFGSLVVAANVNLALPPGARHALIGPNGAGKTTLFAIISGFQRPSGGVVRYQGETITGLPPHELAWRGIARTFQIVQPFAGLSVRENILVGAHLRHPKRSDALAAADIVGREVGLGAMLDRSADSLTVASRKRLELARALATEPKLLLLDEVLAGLNPAEIRDIAPIIRNLCARGISILMIEHVMQAVMSLSQHVFVLAEGCVIAEGTPTEVAANHEVVEAYLGHGAARKLGGAHAH